MRGILTQLTAHARYEKFANFLSLREFAQDRESVMGAVSKLYRMKTNGEPCTKAMAKNPLLRLMNGGESTKWIHGNKLFLTKDAAASSKLDKLKRELEIAR